MTNYLNLAHILRSTAEAEYHPLYPFLPENCRVLFLGSFPPQRKRWCMDFFYPNFQNDHWRIEGEVFFGDRLHFVDEGRKTFRLDLIIPFLHERGIGFYDTATAVRRLKDNASDKFLEVVEYTDVQALIAPLDSLRAIVTTGEKATETLCQRLQLTEIPRVGHYVPLRTLPQWRASSQNAGSPAPVLYRLPSSSRAYPLSLEKKAEAYRRMFTFVGLL